jgi:hypothetical protein
MARAERAAEGVGLGIGSGYGSGVQSATAWLRPALARRTAVGVLVLATRAGLAGCAGRAAPAPAPSTTPTARAAEPEPVLAAPIGRASVGLGTARPRAVSGGGDPTGAIDSITWTSWGGPTARGRGVGCYVPKGSPIAACVRRPVEVLATRLGTCGGRRAYEDLAWWFPTERQTFDPSADFYLRGCVYPPTV